MIGRTLGRYRLEALVGAGGMGEVYRARDERLDRDVAVKVLPPAVATDADRLSRFEREARALAKLAHPNILAIFDFGTDGDVAYSVTELLTGETLRARLGRERLPWRKSVELAAAIAEGLAAAHAQGVVHRDIKPDNLFLTTDGRVKILDFGLAATGPTLLANATTMAQAGAVTAPGVLLGTVGYMAPEQVESGHASARSDIFALGCVLYELLTGQRAFSRATVTETLAAILSAPVADVSASGSDAPPELGRIVRRCVEKQPDERFQSATDLAFALRSTLGGDGAVAVARVAGTGGAVRPRARRRMWLVAAATVVIAAAVFRYWSPWDTRGSAPFGKAPIAVAVFANRTGDGTLDPFGMLLSESVHNGLSRLEGVQVSQDDEAGAVSTVRAAESAEALGQRTGAAFVVEGSYYIDGQTLRVESRIVEAATGRTVVPLDSIAGPLAEKSLVTGQVVSRIMGAVATGEREGLPDLYRPTVYEAYVEYRIAADAFLGMGDPKSVEAHFRRALEIDPAFFRARRGLFVVAQDRGDRTEMRRHLDEIAKLYASLTPHEQARYRYDRAAFEGKLEDRRAAAKDMMRLTGGVNTGSLALAENALHRSEAAAALMVQSRQAMIDKGGYPGNWNTRVFWEIPEIHHELGEYTAQLEDAKLGQQYFPRDVIFISHEVAALVALGRLTEVESAIARGRSISSLRQGSPTSVMRFAAMELRVHGHRPESIEMAASLVAYHRRAPSSPGQRSNLAFALGMIGEWREAHSLALSLATGAPDNLAYQSALGVAAAQVGKRDDARRVADALATRDPSTMAPGVADFHRARILASLGDREAAVDALQLAFRKGREWVGGEIHRDLAFDPIRDYPPFKEFIKPKG